MKKSFAILGLGRFGVKLVEELYHHNADIIAVDNNPDNVGKVAEFVNNAFVCDTTDEQALKELGINNVDHAIVSIGSNLQSTILTTIILKEFGIKKITVRVDDDYYINVIKKLGATDIVSPQKIAGTRVANRVITDTFLDYYEIISDFSVVEISITEDVKERTLAEMDPRNKYGVNLLLIKRNGKTFSPTAEDVIKNNDSIFVFGSLPKINIFDDFLHSNKN